MRQADLRRQEIARERRRRPVSMVALRLAEINRLLTSRYGGEVLPDDDSAREDIEIVAHHLAQCATNQAKKIGAWISLRASWMDADEIDEVIAAAIANPRRWRADTLAKRLNLMDAERRRLRITTIGSVDVDREQRAKARHDRKLGRDRKRAAARRRAAGAKSRAGYLATMRAAPKPWIAARVSKRTWQRRRAVTRSVVQHIASVC